LELFAIQWNTLPEVRLPGVCASLDDLMGRKSNWMKLEIVDTYDNLAAVIEHTKVF
jgi:hypothetical protein